MLFGIATSTILVAAGGFVVGHLSESYLGIVKKVRAKVAGWIGGTA